MSKPSETTPPDGPPRLVVAEEAWEDVRPTAAILRVALTADCFFSDRAVLEKAEELRRLVAALNARGIPAEAVSLEGATLDVSSGLFTRSSSVTYRVRILVKDVGRPDYSWAGRRMARGAGKPGARRIADPRRTVVPPQRSRTAVRPRFPDASRHAAPEP